MNQPYAKFIEVGDVFGWLEVIEIPLADESEWKLDFLCRCACGTVKKVSGLSLKRNRNPNHSCGCYRVERLRAAITTHGATRLPEFGIRKHMLARCLNPNHKSYYNYGGRGIKVCDRWLGPEGFKNFLADVGPRPSKHHSLDRYPDNNGNYEPGNVRWATYEEQNNNRRCNVLFTVNGMTKTAPQWARMYSLPVSFIRRRLESPKIRDGTVVHSLPNVRAIPVTVCGKTYPSRSACAKEYGVDPRLFSQRLADGWPMEKALSRDNWNFTPHPGRGVGIPKRIQQEGEL